MTPCFWHTDIFKILGGNWSKKAQLEIANLRWACGENIKFLRALNLILLKACYRFDRKYVKCKERQSLRMSFAIYREEAEGKVLLKEKGRSWYKKVGILHLFFQFGIDGKYLTTTCAFSRLDGSITLPRYHTSKLHNVKILKSPWSSVWHIDAAFPMPLKFQRGKFFL